MDLVKFKKIVCIYFTPFPYEIYDEANRVSNFAECGIGSGLIDAQRDFWVSNCFLLFIIYTKNNPNFVYLNIGLFLFSNILYVNSFARTIYLIKYL